MEARADRFLSGHYAYFVELPERRLEERVEKCETKASTAKMVDYLPKEPQYIN